MKKKTTIKEQIVIYAKNNYYFNKTELKDYFYDKNIKFKNSTIKQYLFSLKKEKIIYGAGAGWYTIINKSFELDTEPIKGTVTLLKSEFTFLNFSCWSTEQIKGFYHHLPTLFILFIYAEKDVLGILKNFLEEKEFNVYLNPHKKEVEKFVTFRNRTVILRPLVTPRKYIPSFFSNIEKLLVDLAIEMEKLNLMDPSEYGHIISNIIFNYRINIAELLDYSERRNIKEKMCSYISQGNIYSLPIFCRI